MGRQSNTIIMAGSENYSFIIRNLQHFPSCDRNDAEPLKGIEIISMNHFLEVSSMQKINFNLKREMIKCMLK